MKRLGNITLGLWLFVVLLPHESLAATITLNTTGLVNQANVGSLIVTGAASGLPETTATKFNFTSATITTNITPSTNAALVVDMVGPALSHRPVHKVNIGKWASVPPPAP